MNKGFVKPIKLKRRNNRTGVEMLKYYSRLLDGVNNDKYYQEGTVSSTISVDEMIKLQKFGKLVTF